MAPARRTGGRRGGCETTPPHPRTSPGNGHPSQPRPATQPQPSRLFLAPDHRPPLVGVKLVRPRPRLTGATAAGADSTTVPGAGLQLGPRTARRHGQRQLRGEGRANSPHTKARPHLAGHRASPSRSLDGRFPHGCLICHSESLGRPRALRTTDTSAKIGALFILHSCRVPAWAGGVRSLFTCGGVG
jgi:hypothetical protein